LEATEDEPLKVIQEVITQYEVPAEDYKTLRAIGSTLCDYGYQYADLDRQKATLTEGASYIKQAVERMEGDTQEKIATLRLLAPKYTWIDQHADALKYYDQAYDMLPDPESEDLTKEKRKEFMDMRVDILIDKAIALQDIKQTDEALRIYNEARKFSGEDPLSGATLDDITLLFKEDDDPDGSRLMKELKTWTDKERNSWFSYCFHGWVDASAVTRMQRAAKLTGETDLLLGWLYALAKTLPEESYYLFNIRGAIASLYYPVIGDIEKGKALRQEILAMKPKADSWFDETMNEKKTEHRLKLAEILFHEFQTSSDPTKKEALIETLRSLPSAHADDDLQESHVNMLLANMLRIMGPAREYQKHMNELFSACMAGLEDSVSWNDSSSLRLLSKVLGSLDGMERDAMIACAAQFSILDRSIHYQNTDSDDSETASDKDATEADAEDKPTEETPPITETEQPGEEPVPTIETTSTEEAPLASGEPEATSTDAPDEEASKRRDSADVAEAPDTSIAVPEPTAEAPESSAALPTEPDEDLTGAGIFCDGGCGTDINTWTKRIYYCLVCVNCDLCEDCHAKRLAQTRGEIEEPWLSFCGRDHLYIRSPIKGWKGIKNGVIRIEGEEEFTVKDWLKGLKEERWQKAWETFWTRQGGLKNIGIED
jgi:tetratricopeptide (TPR) repeat protein